MGFLPWRPPISSVCFLIFHSGSQRARSGSITCMLRAYEIPCYETHALRYMLWVDSFSLSCMRVYESHTMSNHFEHVAEALDSKVWSVESYDSYGTQAVPFILYVLFVLFVSFHSYHSVCLVPFVSFLCISLGSYRWVHNMLCGNLQTPTPVRSTVG